MQRILTARWRLPNPQRCAPVADRPTSRDACIHRDDQPASRELNASAVARRIAREPIAHATGASTHARHILWCSPGAAFIFAFHHPDVPVVTLRPPRASKEQESVTSNIVVQWRGVPNSQAVSRSEAFPQISSRANQTLFQDSRAWLLAHNFAGVY